MKIEIMILIVLVCLLLGVNIIFFNVSKEKPGETSTNIPYYLEDFETYIPQYKPE